MAKIMWEGSNYYRKRDGSWRNRNSGIVVKKISDKDIVKQKGKRKRVFLKDGTNLIGMESTNVHYYGGQDGKIIKGSQVKNRFNRQRKRSERERKAMFARMKRRR